MEQGQEVRDLDQVGVWEGAKLVASAEEVVLQQVQADTVSVRTVGKERLTNLGLLAMSRSVLSVGRF